MRPNRAPKGTAATKAATAATKQPRAKAKRAALSTGDSNGPDGAAHPPSPKPKRKPRKASSKTAAAADGAAGPTTELGATDGVSAQPLAAAAAAAAAKPARKRQPRKPRDGDATAGDATRVPCDQPQPADVATKAVRKRQPRKPKDATAARCMSMDAVLQPTAMLQRASVSRLQCAPRILLSARASLLGRQQRHQAICSMLPHSGCAHPLLLLAW